jgi:hypothetical protein
MMALEPAWNSYKLQHLTWRVLAVTLSQTLTQQTSTLSGRSELPAFMTRLLGNWTKSPTS